MKTSRRVAPTLFVAAIVAAFGLGVVTQVGSVMAENAANVVEAVSVKALGSTERRCETRYVEADEGYGVSRLERRVVCQ